MKIRRRSPQSSNAAERVGPEPASPFWGEHRSRYHFAAPLSLDARVLDVACGSGFGSLILAEAGADQVVAVDLSLVAFNLRATPHDSVQFLQADGMQLPLKDGTIDLVVSFETIEHLRDGDKFISALKDALRPGGTLLISTPNRDFSDQVKGPPNPFHVHEYTPAEFTDLLTRHFDRVELHGQHVHPRYPVCPYWQLPKAMGRSPLARSRILWWKLQNRMPFRIKDTISRLTRNRGFYPGEFDFVLTDDLQHAHVLVGRCWK